MNLKPSMNRLSGIILLVLTFSVFLSCSSFAATITVCSAGCDSTSIQGAIDLSSPGDTVHVAAATYNEPQILINKSISVVGDGKDSTIIAGDSITELVDPGLVRIVADEGNVVFDGFTVMGAGPSPLNFGISGLPLRVGVYVSSSNPSSVFTISNNRIIGIGDVFTDTEDYGLYAKGGNETLVFISNEVTDTVANAILFDKHAGPTDVSNNVLNEGVYGASAYLSRTYDDLNITSLQKVVGNSISMDTGVGSDVVSAISFETASTLGLGGGYTNILISGNIISNLQDNRGGISLFNDALGDGVAGVIDSPVITSNTITGLPGSVSTVGFQLSGLITDASISSNTASDLEVVFNGDSGRNSIHFPEGIVLNHNSFPNFNKLVWLGPAVLNAKHNWWGVCAGPGSVGPGVNDNISLNVDFAPWLGACVDGSIAQPGCIIAAATPVTLYANVSSLECIGDVWFGVNEDGVWSNHTASPSSSALGNYSYVLGAIDNNQLVSWTAYADDCFGHVTQGPVETFNVKMRTSLSLDKPVPDGLNGWYVSEPSFTLSNADASNIFYRWDGMGPFNYTTPFGLENIPNSPKESAGVLKLTYWSDVCSTLSEENFTFGNFSFGNFTFGNFDFAEPDQNLTFRVDLVNPVIRNVNPPNNSFIINNFRPAISAFLDEVYNSNSGVNRFSIKLFVDGIIVDPSIKDVGVLSSNITFIPPADLSVGIHEVTVQVSDKAGRSSQLDWSFELNKVDTFNMTINSPLEGMYSKKAVPFNIETTETVAKIEFIDHAAKNPVWKVLCKECDSYGSSLKTQSLNDGVHNLTIRATDHYGLVREGSVQLFVDSKLPVILSTSPKKNSVVDGSSFSVNYTEDNLVGVTLFYGNALEGFTGVLMDCDSGVKAGCSASVDLSSFDGLSLDYYFQVSDGSGSVSSRKTQVKVDTSAPLITLGSPLAGSYPKNVPFNLSVSESVKLQYLDLSEGSKWNTLCSQCSEFGSSRLKNKPFKPGSHHVLIRALDKAGNTDVKDVSFVVS